MRRENGTLFCGLLLAITNGYAQVTPSQITLQLNSAHMNDALVDLGRSAQANFMVDVTQFSKDAPSITNSSTGTVKQHLEVLSSEHKLSWLPQQQILLLWTTPDLHQLAQYLVEGDTIKLIAPGTSSAPKGRTDLSAKNTPTTPKTPSKEELLFKDISDYVRDKQDWDDQIPGSTKEVKISSLPPALRDRVVAAVQASLLRPESAVIWKAWFNDKFWDNAQLKLVEETNGNPNGPKIPVLTVGGSMRIGNGSGGSMMSLGALRRPTN